MSLKFVCPKCGKELKAPKHLMGKPVVCPKCQYGFRVGSPAEGGNSDGHVATSEAWKFPPARGEEEPAAVTATERESVAATVAQAPPTSVLRAPTPPSGSAPQGTVVAPPIQESPPAQSPAAQSPAAESRSAATRTPRRPTRAKLITPDSAETRVQLDADGELPHLHLRDDPKKPKEDESAGGSNPLLLIGVVCASITMSVILLFVEPNSARDESQSKTEAREQIRLYYWGAPSLQGPLAAYQKKLREAIQAHHRADYNAEVARYREVLRMLHDESIQDATGLTGVKQHGAPPNDRHLEELLATLLRDD